MIFLRGDRLGLESLLGRPLLLCLFTNEAKVAKRSGIAAFTQPTAAGYKPIRLESGEWQFNETNAYVIANYPEQTFVFREKSPDICGYFVAELDGTPLWADRFEDEDGKAVPVPMRRAGDKAHVSPFVRSA